MSKTKEFVVEEKTISLIVNEKKYKLTIPSNMRLLDLLRDRLRLISVKEGCGEGECGACSVIMNGKLVTSCLVMAVQADGAEITTLEGLGTEDNPSPIQRAYVEAGAVQCGFCTPGMIMATSVLLKEKPIPTEEEIRDGLSGNLCRCTGYVKIIDAVKLASKYKKKQKKNN